jgi:hypothetical protein
MQDIPTSDTTPVSVLARTVASLASDELTVSDLAATFAVGNSDGRKSLITSLAPAPPAGIRTSFSILQMRSALTCAIRICSLHGLRFASFGVMRASVPAPASAASPPLASVALLCNAAAADLISIARSEANSRSRAKTCTRQYYQIINRGLIKRKVGNHLN